MAIAKTDLSHYIDTLFFEKRPHIRGRRIPVAIIAHCAQQHQWTVDEIAYQFTLSPAEVSAALLYYAENEITIEALETQHNQQLKMIG